MLPSSERSARSGSIEYQFHGSSCRQRGGAAICRFLYLFAGNVVGCVVKKKEKGMIPFSPWLDCTTTRVDPAPLGTPKELQFPSLSPLARRASHGKLKLIGDIDARPRQSLKVTETNRKIDVRGVVRRPPGVSPRRPGEMRGRKLKMTKYRNGNGIEYLRLTNSVKPPQ